MKQRKRKRSLIAVLLFIMIVNSIHIHSMTVMAAAQSELKGNYEQGAVMVKYHGEPLLLHEKDINLIDSYSFDDFTIGYYKSEQHSTKQLIEIMNTYEAVDYAEPNYKSKTYSISNDTYNDKQWYMDKDTENLEGIKTPNIDVGYAWEQLDLTGGTEKESVVAVIDSGVDYTHPDLAKHMWVNKTDLPGTHGYDFLNDDEDPMDDLGHGTLCAGIIAAEIDNSLGVAGISPNTKIMALKYMDEKGSGLISEAIEAYQYVIDAKDQGVNVVAISNSWGTTDNSRLLEEMIELAGKKEIISVCAAGNLGTDLDVEQTYPAAYDSPYILVVAASTNEDAIASFSSYGKRTVDVAAPGTSILSTYHEDAYIPGLADTDRYLYTFEDGIQPFSGQQVSISSNRSFRGKSALYYRPKLTKSDEVYVKNKNIKYTNVLSYELLEPSKENEFFGFNIKSIAQDAQYQYLYIDGYVNKKWKNLGIVEISGDNFWDSKWYPLTKGTKKIRLVAIGIEKETEIYLDDIGIGTTTGKYAYFQGTSMAAPMVAAEVVILSKIYPGADASQIRARIAGGVDQTIAPGQVVSNGRINLKTAIDSPYAVIDSLEHNKKGQLIIKGNFFGKKEGTVSILGEKLPVLSWSDTKVKVEYNGDYNGYVAITMTRGDDKTSIDQELLLLNAKYAWEEETKLPVALNDMATAVYEDKIYVFGGTTSEGEPSNEIYCYDTKEKKWTEEGQLPETENPNLFASQISAATINDQIILYTYDDIGEQIRCYQYSILDGTMTEMTFTKMPQVRSNAVLVTYQNTVYMIGGILKGKYYEHQNLAKYVWKLSEDMSTWEKAFTLDDARYNVIAGVANDLLIITGGYNVEGKHQTKTQVFDGVDVTTKVSLPYPGLESNNSVIGGDNTLYVMNDGISFEKPGLIYDPATNQWTTTEYCMGQGQVTKAGGAVCGDRIYMIGGLLDDQSIDLVQSFPFVEEKKEEITPTIIPTKEPEVTQEPQEPQEPTVTPEIEEETGSKLPLLIFAIVGITIVVILGCIVYFVTHRRK